MKITSSQITNFQDTVWQYYNDFKRDLPWRNVSVDGAYNPYHILVSEIMLQQTQVPRVIPKYELFLKLFPDVASLADAPLQDVLTAWSGLGYNRRAKFLHQAAAMVASEFGGTFPDTTEELIKLPGVGNNTAAAIVAYSFNQPVVFIETNIRSVYIHHFFKNQTDISDRQLFPIIEQTILAGNSREWYWALMDYGSYLKSILPNPSRASKHHSKQSRFEGSRRQIRGEVIKLLSNGPITQKNIESLISDERLNDVLTDLLREGLISKIGTTYHLGKMI